MVSKNLETSANISIDDYVCNICNKIYKNKSGIWKHNKKYHINNNNTMYDKQVINGNNNTLDNTLDNTLKLSLINLEIEKNILDYKYNCKKCNKKFNNYQNRWKHEKICKTTNENIDILKKKYFT